MNSNNMLSPHPSASLEYWFFKVNSGPIALIVDWIEKRNLNEHWLRISIHSPHRREVIFKKLDNFMPSDISISTYRTIGNLGDISWDLKIDTGDNWIKPDIIPAGMLKMIDLSLISAPLVNFTGWIHHGPHKTNLNQTSGLVSHYWGRQLAIEWWWIAAHQFDKEGVAVECTLVQSSLWGTSISFPIAYLYLCEQSRKELIMAPLGLGKVKGNPESFQIDINRILGEKLILIGKGREYGDFGDGIMNTLVGDLDIYKGNRLIARAEGTAGLERRTPVE